MSILVISVFIVTIFFSLLYLNSRFERCVILFVVTSLMFMCAFRNGADRDYLTYVEYYNTINTMESYEVEPSFILISQVVKYLFFNQVFFLFVIYAIMGIGIKAKALFQLTDFKILSLVTYISFYFLMHDMTQIRAGVASGIVLLCIKPLYDRKLCAFFILVLLAIFFHYSALAIIPLVLLKPNSINKRFYILLIPLGYFLCFIHLDITSLLNLIPIPYIQSKIQAYLYLQTYSDNVEMPNIFNVVFVIRCTVASLLVLFANLLYKRNRYSYLLIKIYVIGLFFFLMLSNVAGFAYRISELYGIVEIILLPFLCYLFVQRKTAFIFPIIISAFFLYIELFYVKLLS